MKIYLFHLTGSNQGYTDIFDLEKGQSLRIGRHPSNDLQLHPELDLNASGFHAELRFDGEHFSLVDVGSSFGTYLNGQPIRDARLKSRDKVRFGTEGPTVKIYLDRDVKHCPICQGPLLKHNFVCYDCQRKICHKHFDPSYGVCETCASMAQARGLTPEVYRASKGIKLPPASSAGGARPGEPPVPPAPARAGRPNRKTVVLEGSDSAWNRVRPPGEPVDPSVDEPTAAAAGRTPPGEPGGGRVGGRKTQVLDLGGGPPPPAATPPAQGYAPELADTAFGLRRGTVSRPAPASATGRPPAGGAQQAAGSAQGKACGLCGQPLSGAWFTCRICGQRLCLAHFYAEDTCEPCYGAGKQGVRRERTDPERAVLQMGAAEAPPPPPPEDEIGPGSTTSGQLKRCPYCAELIQMKAIKCKYCKEYLTNPQNLNLPGDQELPLIDFDADDPKYI